MSDWTSLQNLTDNNHINFALGHPSLLPTELLLETIRTVCETCENTVENESSFLRFEASLKYTSRRGSPATLRVMSTFLSKAFDEQDKVGSSTHPSNPFSDAHADNLLITGGVSQGIDMACAALTQPGDLVVIELPTYFLAANIFKDHGLSLLGIQGICSDSPGGNYFDVDELQLQLQGGLRPRLVYLIPSHSNPTGGSMPLSKRRQLVDLAIQYEFYIFADEVYHLLTWGEQPPPPRFFEVMKCNQNTETKDESQRNHGVGPTTFCPVISFSSFSKILAPGLRLGWIEAASELIERISNRGYLSSGGCIAPFTSGMVANFISSGRLSVFLTTLKETYKKRSNALAKALEAEAETTGWHFAGMPCAPSGGYFLWLRLPPDTDTCSLAAEARVQNVSYLPGDLCFLEGGEDSVQTTDVYIRLCFAFLTTEEIIEGVRRLSLAVRATRSETIP